MRGGLRLFFFWKKCFCETPYCTMYLDVLSEGNLRQRLTDNLAFFVVLPRVPADVQVLLPSLKKSST